MTSMVGRIAAGRRHGSEMVAENLHFEIQPQSNKTYLRIMQSFETSKPIPSPHPQAFPTCSTNCSILIYHPVGGILIPIITPKVCMPLLYTQGYPAMLAIVVVHRCHSWVRLLFVFLFWKLALCLESQSHESQSPGNRLSNQFQVRVSAPCVCSACCLKQLHVFLPSATATTYCSSRPLSFPCGYKMAPLLPFRCTPSRLPFNCHRHQAYVACGKLREEQEMTHLHQGKPLYRELKTY